MFWSIASGLALMMLGGVLGMLVMALLQITRDP